MLRNNNSLRILVGYLTVVFSVLLLSENTFSSIPFPLSCFLVNTIFSRVFYVSMEKWAEFFFWNFTFIGD